MDHIWNYTAYYCAKCRRSPKRCICDCNCAKRKGYKKEPCNCKRHKIFYPRRISNKNYGDMIKISTGCLHRRCGVCRSRIPGPQTLRWGLCGNCGFVPPKYWKTIEKHFFNRRECNGTKHYPGDCDCNDPLRFCFACGCSPCRCYNAYGRGFCATCGGFGINCIC